MRILPIRDTHGNLGIINELADLIRAEPVIHAGDFGSCDDESPEHLSDRELRLHVVHSHLRRFDEIKTRTLSRSQLIELVREYHLPGDFQTYLDGREAFHVPVYAIWGNHEDERVVERLFQRKTAIENLRILDHLHA